jgi:hypothetical protein
VIGAGGDYEKAKQNQQSRDYHADVENIHDSDRIKLLLDLGNAGETSEEMPDPSPPLPR